MSDVVLISVLVPCLSAGMFGLALFLCWRHTRTHSVSVVKQVTSLLLFAGDGWN